ncbi:MAG: PilN domain-containing protein [Dehalococcoidia bacterium]
MQADALVRPRFIDLNLLPQELRSGSRSGWYFVALLALVVAAPLLLPLYQAQDTSWSKASALEEQWASVERGLAGLQADFVSTQELRGELAATNAELNALNMAREAALGDARRAAGLAAVVERLPEGVRLLTVDDDGLRLRIAGEAANTDGAFEYARALEGSSAFAAVTVTVTAIEQSQAGVRFTIEAGR